MVCLTLPLHSLYLRHCNLGNSRARASGTPGLVLGPTAHRSSTIGGNQVTTGGQAPPVSLGSDTEGNCQ